MHSRESRTFFNECKVWLGIEKTDVVGNRTGEQGVILHHRADTSPPVFDAILRQWLAADDNLSRHRIEHSQQHVH